LRKQFSTDDRLSKNTSKVIEEGRRLREKNIVFYYMPFERPCITVIASRKVGKSNMRNKLKRWAKEKYRLERNTLQNYATVVIFKPGAAQYDHGEVDHIIDKLWQRAGIIK